MKFISFISIFLRVCVCLCSGKYCFIFLKLLNTVWQRMVTLSAALPLNTDERPMSSSETIMFSEGNTTEPLRGSVFTRAKKKKKKWPVSSTAFILETTGISFDSIRERRGFFWAVIGGQCVFKVPHASHLSFLTVYATKSPWICLSRWTGFYIVIVKLNLGRTALSWGAIISSASLFFLFVNDAALEIWTPETVPSDAICAVGPWFPTDGSSLW